MNQRLCRNMSRGIHEIIIIDLLAAKWSPYKSPTTLKKTVKQVSRHLP
jgi:hypothetical protein